MKAEEGRAASRLAFRLIKRSEGRENDKPDEVASTAASDSRDAQPPSRRGKPLRVLVHQRDGEQRISLWPCPTLGRGLCRLTTNP